LMPWSVDHRPINSYTDNPDSKASIQPGASKNRLYLVLSLTLCIDSSQVF
jgi:hypothetical protein